MVALIANQEVGELVRLKLNELISRTAGGTTGQLLAKADNTDHGFTWADPGAGGTASLNALSDVTLESEVGGEILQFVGGFWINRTLAEAGIASAAHTHTLADVTDAGALAALDTVGAAQIDAGAVGPGQLAPTTVTAGSYTNTNLTVDADGRITAAANGTSGGGGAPDAHATTHVTGGTDVIADAVASGNSGLMSGADKAKLDGVEAGATADQSAAEVSFTPAGNLAAAQVQAALEELDAEKAATTHTHTAAQISDSTADGRAVLTAADANPFTDAEQTKLAGLGGTTFNAQMTFAAGSVADEDDIAGVYAPVLADLGKLKRYTGAGSTWTINAVAGVGEVAVENDGTGAITLTQGTATLSGGASVAAGKSATLRFFNGGLKCKALVEA